jgi:hypothetical protein
MARCGVPDVGEYNHFPRHLKWQNTIVTFRWGLSNTLSDIVSHNPNLLIVYGIGVIMLM